jgi:hypothetical protein
MSLVEPNAHRVIATHKSEPAVCEGCGKPLSEWAEWHQVKGKKLYHLGCCPICYPEPSLTRRATA